MPWEYALLKNKPCPTTDKCCSGLCEPFMRGMVHSWWRKMLGMPYCAVICPISKEIIGWEKPEKKANDSVLNRRPF